MGVLGFAFIFPSLRAKSALVCSFLLSCSLPAVGQDAPWNIARPNSAGSLVTEKDWVCQLEETSSFSYTDSGSGLRRVLGIWHFVNCKIEEEATVPVEPVVKGDYLTSGILFSDGPASRPLEKILSSSKGAAKLGEDPQALALFSGEIFLFWYAPRSCVHGSLGALVLPYSLKDPGTSLEQRLLFKKPARPARVIYPMQDVVVEKECGPKRLTARVDGHQILLSLERWDGTASLGRFLFAPEDQEGCAKWYGVDLEMKRLRYARPIGAPDEEWKYIEEMEKRCADF